MIFNIQIFCAADNFLELIMVLIPSLMQAIGGFPFLKLCWSNVERERSVPTAPRERRGAGGSGILKIKYSLRP